MNGTERAIFRTLLVIAFLPMLAWAVGKTFITEIGGAFRYAWLEIFIFCADWRDAFRKGWQ